MTIKASFICWNNKMAKFKLIFFFLFGFWQPAFCQLLPEMEWAGKDSVVTLYSQVDHQVKIKTQPGRCSHDAA